MKKEILLSRSLFLFCCLLLYVKSEAQQDNSDFYQSAFIDTSQAGALDLRIENFNFLKNNEYYTNIADGMTFFGFHLKPTFSYQPGKNFRLNAGIFLWKDFGNPEFSRVAPVFTLSYQKDNHSIHFGNIKGPLEHLYIEPLMNFERAIHSPLENGIQYILSNRKVFLDFWINWKKALYRGQQDQEEIRAGISFSQVVFKNEKSSLRIPVQVIAEHKGGQISPSPIPVSNLLNGASGIEFSRKITSRVLRSTTIDLYYLSSLDYSSQPYWPFSKGYGFYSNLALESKYLTLMLSYWHSEKFINIQGGELYSALSSSIRNTGYSESGRNILILRLMRDVKITDNLTFTVRLEPYWDIRNKLFEYSFGFYIHYNDIFRINKI